MDCAAFVPKGQEFQFKEIDQNSNQSDTTKSNSDNEFFEEGAIDETSDAMKDYNTYCEATRKKQKKNFANIEERQEFN